MRFIIRNTETHIPVAQTIAERNAHAIVGALETYSPFGCRFEILDTDTDKILSRKGPLSS